MQKLVIFTLSLLIFALMMQLRVDTQKIAILQAELHKAALSQFNFLTEIDSTLWDEYMTRIEKEDWGKSSHSKFSYYHELRRVDSSFNIHAVLPVQKIRDSDSDSGENGSKAGSKNSDAVDSQYEK